MINPTYYHVTRAPRIDPENAERMGNILRQHGVDMVHIPEPEPEPRVISISWREFVKVLAIGGLIFAVASGVMAVAPDRWAEREVVL